MKIQLYILTKDRPHYLEESLNSALNQKNKYYDLQILISDNSTKDDTERYIKKANLNIIYKRRKPPCSVWDHYKLILKEANCDYLILFHDDDILSENYIDRMLNAIKAYPNASAIGCYADILNMKTGERTPQTTDDKNLKIFTTQKEFFEMYLPANVNKISPFPSYIYRSNAVSLNDINPEDGEKYSDVSFLSKKIKTGPIIWIPEILMTYRIHDNNDTSNYSISGKRKLRLFMEKNGYNRKDKEMIDYKIESWYKWMLEQKIVKKSPSPIVPENLKQYNVLCGMLHRENTKKYKLFYWRIIIGLYMYKFKRIFSSKPNN